MVHVINIGLHAHWFSTVLTLGHAYLIANQRLEVAPYLCAALLTAPSC